MAKVRATDDMTCGGCGRRLGEKTTHLFETAWNGIYWCGGVSELAVALVKKVGAAPVTDSPYRGTGKSAEHITLANCDILDDYVEDVV